MPKIGMEDHEFALYCPVTYSVFQDPVKAEDGRTYEREGIEAWFQSCRQRNLAITSPWTREEIGTSLVPDAHAAEHAERLRRQLAEKGASTVLSLVGRPVTHDSSSSSDLGAVLSNVSSIHDLRRVFATLDPLRNILEQSLDGWQPPQLIVIGEENSGKSSLLERLAMMPIFPRNKGLCTRLPIHVKLRNTDKCLPATLEVSLSRFYVCIWYLGMPYTCTMYVGVGYTLSCIIMCGKQESLAAHSVQSKVCTDKIILT